MQHSARWRAWLARLWNRTRLSTTVAPRLAASPKGAGLLIVVEGVHDVAFLKSISTMLHAHEPALPDLAALEHRGELIFVPFGGSDLKLWSHRLAPLEVAEFHLYDREDSPETERRRQLAVAVNTRPGCRAAVTSKRSLENYLHPAAILEAGGVEIEFDDDDDVAELIARRLYARDYPDECWGELPRRKQTRRRNRVKQWLNRSAAARMTPERLAERDRQGDVRSWLVSMVELMADEG